MATPIDVSRLTKQARAGAVDVWPTLLRASWRRADIEMCRSLLHLMLERWTQSPLPRLARCIEHLEALVEDDDARALRVCDDKRIPQDAWLHLAADPNVLRRNALMDTLRRGRTAEVRERLEPIAGWPLDPCVSGVLTGWLEGPPFRATSSQPLWNTIFDILHRHQDPRTLQMYSRFQEPDFEFASGKTMRSWMHKQVALRAAELQAASPQLGSLLSVEAEGELQPVLDALEEALLSFSGEVRFGETSAPLAPLPGSGQGQPPKAPVEPGLEAAWKEVHPIDLKVSVVSSVTASENDALAALSLGLRTWPGRGSSDPVVVVIDRDARLTEQIQGVVTVPMFGEPGVYVPYFPVVRDAVALSPQGDVLAKREGPSSLSNTLRLYRLGDVFEPRVAIDAPLSDGPNPLNTEDFPCAPEIAFSADGSRIAMLQRIMYPTHPGSTPNQIRMRAAFCDVSGEVGPVHSFAYSDINKGHGTRFRPPSTGPVADAVACVKAKSSLSRAPKEVTAPFIHKILVDDAERVFVGWIDQPHVDAPRDTASSTLWTQVDGKKMKVRKKAITAGCLTRDGVLIFAEKKTVRFMSLVKRAKARHFSTQHAYPMHAMALDASEQILATGSDDSAVKIWEISGPELPKAPLAELQEHHHPIRALAFHPGGDWLASGDAGGSVHLSAVRSGRRQASIPTEAPVVGLAWSWAADTLILAAGNEVQWWDMQREEMRKRVALGGSIRAMARASSSDLLAVADDTGVVALVHPDLEEPRVISQNHYGADTDLVFAARGRRLYVSSGRYGQDHTVLCLATEET